MKLSSVKQPGNQALITIIRREIEASGPVSFAWFMEQALYHPEHGFYSSGRAGIGRAGDYYTNVSVGPIFGQLLARQLYEIWEKLGKSRDFVIVEQGVHRGDLADDVLTTVAKTWPDWFDNLHYRIIEPFPAVRHHQEKTLGKFGERIEWLETLNDLPPFIGVFFSNELLDAMPVHLVRSGQQPGEWMEKLVDWRNGQLEFVERPVTNRLLEEQLDDLPQIPSGIEVEINLAALNWIDLLSEKLTGIALTIDYGYVAQQLAEPARRCGSLQCRQKHQLIHSPFDAIGNCDITAHVNWTAIANRARTRGLEVCGFADQHHFLTGLISEYPECVESANPAGRRQLLTLMHPETMGRSFQVLALGRGIDQPVSLSGFKFARAADLSVL